MDGARAGLDILGESFRAFVPVGVVFEHFPGNPVVICVGRKVLDTWFCSFQ